MSKKKDLTGQPFGSLTVIEPGEKTPHGQSTWICRCTCGRQISRRSDHFVPGKNHTCGKCPARRKPSPTQSDPETNTPLPPPSTPPLSSPSRNGTPQSHAQNPATAQVRERQHEKLLAIHSALSQLVEHGQRTLNAVASLLNDLAPTTPPMPTTDHLAPITASPETQTNNDDDDDDGPANDAEALNGDGTAGANSDDGGPVNAETNDAEAINNEGKAKADSDDSGPVNAEANGSVTDDADPIHPSALQLFLDCLGFIPDAPNVPEPDPSPQRQANTALAVHRSNGNAKPTPTPIPDQSSQVTNPPDRSSCSFPNIHTPHQVRPAADSPGQFSVTLSLRSTQRFLGAYPTKVQAHFAVRVAILLNQLLTPAQRNQQDIILEPDQAARLNALEREYDFDGKTKDEIKEEVALHLLDSNQEIIWTRFTNHQPQVRQTVAAMADEIHRSHRPGRERDFHCC